MNQKPQRQHDAGCPCCTEGTDAYLESLVRRIKEDGYTFVSTWHATPDGQDAPMTYTVGLHLAGLPELVVFNVRPQDGEIILRNVAHKLLHGTLKCSVPQADILRSDVYAQSLTPAQTDGVLNFAALFADGPVHALQIVLPDGNGLFPWEEGCHPSAGRNQPLLYLPAGVPAVKPTPLEQDGDAPWRAKEAAYATASQNESIDADRDPSRSTVRRPGAR